MVKDNPDSRRQSKELIHVKRICFLVHPGFIGDCSDKSKADLMDNPRSERYDNARKIFRRYKDKARTLGEDELLVGFSHLSSRKLAALLRSEDEYGQLLLENLTELRDILGRRFIFLSADFEIFGWAMEDLYKVGETIKHMKKLAESRGYRITRESIPEAFGETFGACVEEGAMFINEAAGFHRNTSVIVQLCDPDGYRGITQEQLDAHNRSANMMWKRIEYVYEEG